jgi:hypothetical protein
LPAGCKDGRRARLFEKTQLRASVVPQVTGSPHLGSPAARKQDKNLLFSLIIERELLQKGESMSDTPFLPHLRKCAVAELLSVVLLLAGTAAWGQQTTADVLGTVTDASGAVLPAVTITVHNLDTAADYTATSDTLEITSSRYFRSGGTASKRPAPASKL